MVLGASWSFACVSLLELYVVLKPTLLAITVLLLALSLVQAPYLSLQPLQNLPTVLALAGLLVCLKRGWLSDLSFACLVVFLWLHILGARYIYSYVPYDQWTAAVFGSEFSDWFGWRRNHYDRLVHFAFGLLCVVPVVEVSIRHMRLGWWLAVAMGVMAIASVSAVYEVFKWGIAVVMAPEYAERYNGQQGDLWDPQKDMALAMLGSVVAVGLLGFRRSVFNAENAVSAEISFYSLRSSVFFAGSAFKKRKLVKWPSVKSSATSPWTMIRRLSGRFSSIGSSAGKRRLLVRRAKT